jgi:phage-related protein
VVRKIIAYKGYFIDFYKVQEDKVQEKIEYVLDLVRFERQVPIKFFKALENTDGIYEVRVITTYKSIRILCFFDDGNLVVLANCFTKKTQKTPRKEIKLAEKLKKEYLKEKNSGYE